MSVWLKIPKWANNGKEREETKKFIVKKQKTQTQRKQNRNWHWGKSKTAIILIKAANQPQIVRRKFLTNPIS